MRMYWRVFGPAWTRPEIDSQLESLRDARVGGVVVYFMYPVALDEPARGIHNQRFLSPEFLDTFGYAARKAKSLGLRFSVAGGTGWPFGGPSVKVSDSAQRLHRVVVSSRAPGQPVSRPSAPAGERLVALFADGREVGETAPPEGAGKTAGSEVAEYELYTAGPTSMRVKRPAWGAEGLVVDHYKSEPLEAYLEAVVQPMLRAAPGQIESVFCDSLEVYGSDWTEDFPGQFQGRRGYDLLPQLPGLFSTTASAGPDLRFDFWRTLSELTEERFTVRLSEWLHHRDVKLEMEAYGTPPNPLTAAGSIDVPTGEQYEWKGFSLSRLAASGAHLARKQIIGAEAWTWTGLPNRLGDSLSDLKLASDLHFLAGVNELTGVDFAYSPRGAGAPGWLPYYGPVMNQNNPQWAFFPQLVDYVNRCQWLLRQGRSVADVAVYLPVEDAFASGPVDQMPLGFLLRDHFASGEKTGEFGLKTALRHESDLLHTLITRGFNYDGIDFFTLNRAVSLQDGKLGVGDGRYSILILPNLAGMDADALEEVSKFCRAGGTVIATQRLPGRGYGYKTSGRTDAVGKLILEMFGPVTGAATDRVVSRRHGHGRTYFLPDEKESLVGVLKQLDPDVVLEPHQPDVSFVHRQTGSQHVYFLANVAEQPVSFRASFRVGHAGPNVWNPMDGSVRPAESFTYTAGHTSVPLMLPARGSTFVVFGPEQRPPASLRKPVELSPPTHTTPLDIRWAVTFDGPEAPAPREATELASWTSWPGGKFFSGRAVYQGTFKFSGPLPRKAILRFDSVHEAAAVGLNGQDAGVVWTPPYEVDITRMLRPGTNLLAIVVANLPVNRFLGLPEEDLAPLRRVYGERFPAPSEKKTVTGPAASGLIGRVRLAISPE